MTGRCHRGRIIGRRPRGGAGNTRAARVVGQAAAERAGDTGGALEEWSGPQRQQFENSERGLAGDARALEAELRDAATHVSATAGQLNSSAADPDFAVRVPDLGGPISTLTARWSTTSTPGRC